MYKPLGKGQDKTKARGVLHHHLVGTAAKGAGILALAIILLLLLATPVYATDPPDSISIEVIYVNRNLLETGDFLLIAHYNIAYTTIPDERADETFTFRLMDTDATTELGAALPYPYATMGYGQGVVSFYFTAADAPTWGQEYYLRVSGNPVHFDNPPVENFSVLAGDYTLLTDSTANQDQLATRVQDIAVDLEVAWDVTLLSEQDTGTFFSSAGEAYFRNAIRGLQAMAADLFFVQTIPPDFTGINYTTNQATIYQERFDGTWVGDALDDAADLLHVSDEMLVGMGILVGCVALIGVSAKKMRSVHPGFIASILLSLCGGLLFGYMSGLAIAGIFFVIYIGYITLFQRA